MGAQMPGVLSDEEGHAVHEIIFIVEKAPEGGYTARALGASIFTEADTLPELREMVREAVRYHLHPGKGPPAIRLHMVRQQVPAA